MNKHFAKFLFTLLCLFPAAMNAQTFATQFDTVHTVFYGPLPIDVHNDIIISGSNNVRIQWQVIAQNFTSDTTWSNHQDRVGICDNYSCITDANNQLLLGWVDTAIYYHSTTGAPDSTDMFKASFGLAPSNPGTHYMTVKLQDRDSPFFKNITFIVTKWPLEVEQLAQQSDLFSLFPNPAYNELNLQLAANVKNGRVEIFDQLGRPILLQTVVSSSCTINIAHLSVGTYFIRLLDNNGTVATKRFVKE